MRLGDLAHLATLAHDKFLLRKSEYLLSYTLISFLFGDVHFDIVNRVGFCTVHLQVPTSEFSLFCS